MTCVPSPLPFTPIFISRELGRNADNMAALYLVAADLFAMTWWAPYANVALLYRLPLVQPRCVTQGDVAGVQVPFKSFLNSMGLS